MNAELVSKGVFVIGLAAVAFVGLSTYSRKPAEPVIVEATPDAAPAPPPETPVQIKQKMLGNISLKTTKQAIEGFGNVLVISFSIKNRNHFPIKDVVVFCNVTGASGTTLSNNRKIVYEVVPTNSVIMVKDLNMGFIDTQSKIAGCIAEDFTL